MAMYRTYWIAWGALLALTVTMVVLDQAPLPRSTFIVLMLSAMLVKAAVIAGYFMHLRFERWALVAAVVLGLPINAAILYVLIVADARRIFDMLGTP
jgi:cytochrome c oxidase subunit IV